jgi:glycosyltransferase involved in cell wall biosynthesis
MTKLPTYALITPARNEAQYIELTLKSVTAQSVCPLKWVIVSDGSTDGTDEIVSRYAAGRPWIELLRLPERKERDFAAKVRAFDAGYEKLAGLEFDVVGNLDADVSFEADYFEFLMNTFAANPQLGVGGTAFVEHGQQYDYRFTNIEHVSGQIQLFRRACFEEIGGYQPRKAGGIDWVAVTTARMKGWKTRTFPEKVFEHHRKMSTASQSAFMVPLKGGQKDYVLGNHPLWELFRCIYQTVHPPIVVGGGMRLAGFLWAMVTRRQDRVSPELVAFTRKEQMHRLWKLVGRS